MEIVKLILEQNPGIVTVLLTSVVLPIAILWLTNRNNRKLKELEKSIDLKFKTKDEIREQEKKVYSSLSKILLMFSNYTFPYPEHAWTHHVLLTH